MLRSSAGLNFLGSYEFLWLLHPELTCETATSGLWAGTTWWLPGLLSAGLARQSASGEAVPEVFYLCLLERFL